MAEIQGIEDLSPESLQLELDRGGRFVVYQYAISVLIMSFRRSSAIHFVRAGDSAVVKGLPYTLLTICFGWWGIPWGPIFTVQTLVTNLRGGKDVTVSIVESLANTRTDQGGMPPAVAK